MLKKGENSPIPGFLVVEARPGRYEVQRTLAAGTVVCFTGSTPEQVLDRAASWVGEQAKRKDGGALSITVEEPPPKPKTRKKAVKA